MNNRNSNNPIENSINIQAKFPEIIEIPDGYNPGSIYTSSDGKNWMIGEEFVNGELICLEVELTGRTKTFTELQQDDKLTPVNFEKE